MSEIRVQVDAASVHLALFEEGPDNEADVWQALHFHDADQEQYTICYFEAEKGLDTLDLINLAVETLRDSE